MEIQEYLKDQEKRVSAAGRRIVEPKVFDFSYVPERPLMRDELKPVIDSLLRFEQTGIPNHLLIVGSRGCGKTLCMRHLERVFSQRGLPVLYGNCRIHNTSYKLLAHFVGTHARGLSFAELVERFTAAHPGKTVVVLDEVDLLSDKDRNREILYFLSRSSVRYMAVALSNNPRWAASLDESTQSTLQPEQVYFRPYTPVEMRQILLDRARIGLREVAEEVVEQIAAQTVKYTDSDVRVAIKALYYWAAEPETPVEESFHRARKDVVGEVVAHLNDKNLLILKAAALADGPVKQVYRAYRRLCKEQREEPFSYVYFSSSLSYLQSLGLILLITTKVRRAYTRLIQLTFPPEVLEKVWRYRFEG
jgi:Cdc6-like AAA superfamily ATPase